MNENNNTTYDMDSYDVVTTAILELINEYPGLPTGDEIAFNTLSADAGKAMFPGVGAIVVSERKYITGQTEQVCSYPFYVIYRGSGLSQSRRAAVKEWLDNLGRWLGKQPITVNGTTYQLTEWPVLSGKREFVGFQIQTPGHQDNTQDNMAEDWAILISARYRNEF